MNFADWYPLLRRIHLALVATSVALFALRTLAAAGGAGWPLTAAPRMASVLIDTALASAGAMLWVGLGLNPLRESWLGVKLLLLLVYIGLGALALRRARRLGMRLALLGAALSCAGFMASVAITHHPLGFLRP